jgi:hypothetical protein
MSDEMLPMPARLSEALDELIANEKAVAERLSDTRRVQACGARINALELLCGQIVPGANPRLRVDVTKHGWAAIQALEVLIEKKRKS